MTDQESSRMGAGLARIAALVLSLLCLAPLLDAQRHALRSFWLKETAPRPTTEQWGSPRAGEDVLPAPVRAMIALLRDRGVMRFRTSPGFKDADESIRQRLYEGSYPIVVDLQASTVLLLPGEKLPPGCRLVEARAEASLADCR